MVAVYVDDLAIGMKDPKPFLTMLTDKYKFKLKGSGPISFHLGCDFERDSDGVLCMSPKQYIDRMVSQYERMFGSKPRTNITSPLEKNDHPEIDNSELLDEEGVQQYQSLIGSLQWAVSLGRFDVTTAVMTLSSFRAIPRRGHLERAKRVVAYLYRFKSAQIRFRTHEPDLTDLTVPEYDWADTVYGKAREEVPADAPPPLGRSVVTVSYVDANLLHCLNTGRSVTGILHFLNGTPVDWYSKKMATVETATYGAEFVAARTCVEQLVDLRNTLRYLGVPLREKSYMFGDNESVVNSAITPHAKLHKRHNALSFHRVREAIASGVYVFSHIPGENNPADILSKHWGYSSVWHMLKVLLYVKGDTSVSPGKDEKENEATKMVTGTADASYNTSMCSIQPHKWENDIGNAHNGFDLILSGCTAMQEHTMSGGKGRNGVGCSSGSGSDKDSALAAYIPMYDRYDTLIDDNDDVYTKSMPGQSCVQASSTVSSCAVEKGAEEFHVAYTTVRNGSRVGPTVTGPTAGVRVRVRESGFLLDPESNQLV